MAKPVEIQKLEQDTIWTIAINRPEVRNCVNGDTATHLKNALVEFDKDNTALVAVVYGKGGCFCAGFDLKVLTGHSESNFTIAPVPQIDSIPKHEEYDVTGIMGFSRLLLRKPVIAAVSGYAVAGGLELACWCDLRVAEEDAVFGVFCRRWGVPLVDGGTVRLTRLIGVSRALDMVLTGRPVSGKEALEFGLANRLVPKGKSLEAAIELAKLLTTFPQNCMRADRMSVYHSFDGGSIKGALSDEYSRGIVVLDEASKGAANFVTKKVGRHGSYESFSKSKL